MVTAEVRFHFRDRLERRHGLHAFRGCLLGQRDELGGGRLGFLPFLESGFVLFDADTRLVALQREVGEALAVQAGDIALEIVVVRRAEEDAGEAAHGHRGEVPLRCFQRDGFLAVELVDGRRIEQVADRLFAGNPQGAVGRAVEEFGRAGGSGMTCGWRVRSGFALLGTRPEWHELHLIAGAVLKEEPGHIEDRVGVARGLHLARHRFHGARIGNQAGLPAGKRCRAFAFLPPLKRGAALAETATAFIARPGAIATLRTRSAEIPPFARRAITTRPLGPTVRARSTTIMAGTATATGRWTRSRSRTRSPPVLATGKRATLAAAVESPRAARFRIALATQRIA